MIRHQIKWLQRAYESLTHAAAALDCQHINEDDGQEHKETDINSELVEAITVDVNRICNAVRRVLYRENALPEWDDAKQAENGDIEF